MLVIQSVVKLLNDFHYDIFVEHVANHSKRSFYPQLLVEAIDRNFEKERSSDDLCEEVYEAKDEKTKKKFFQLGHHTFKLTAHLAKNYPDYLHHNISKLQAFINQGELQKTERLAEMLLEISTKIEDHYTELKVLQLLSMQNLLLESYDKTLKYQKRISEILETEQQLNELTTYFYTHINPKGIAAKEDVIHADFFEKQHQHPSVAVRLVSMYYYIYTYYHLRDQHFYTQEMYKKLLKLETDLQKFDYVLFPYMIGCVPKVGYFKLHYLIHQEGLSSVLEESEELVRLSEDYLYWNSFVNFAEIFFLSVQSSYYSSLYMKSYRAGYYDNLDKEVKEKLDILKAKCKKLLDNEILEQHFTVRYINLSTIYALFLLCGDEDDLKEAVLVLESLLLSYQQVAFHAFIDPIYSVLIIAHFCLKNYDKIDEHYKRYRRSTKGKIVNKENDSTLHGFYYAAKWAQTQRKQYLKKLDAILEDTKQPNLQGTQKILMDVVSYYEIPVSFIPAE